MAVLDVQNVYLPIDVSNCYAIGYDSITDLYYCYTNNISTVGSSSYYYVIDVNNHYLTSYKYSDSICKDYDSTLECSYDLDLVCLIKYYRYSNSSLVQSTFVTTRDIAKTIIGGKYYDYQGSSCSVMDSYYSIVDTSYSYINFTTETYYRNDFPDILIVFVLLCIVIFWLPIKILFRLFRRFN